MQLRERRRSDSAEESVIVVVSQCWPAKRSSTVAIVEQGRTPRMYVWARNIVVVDEERERPLIRVCQRRRSP